MYRAFHSGADTIVKLQEQHEMTHQIKTDAEQIDRIEAKLDALANALDEFGEAILNLIDPAIDDQAEPAAAPQDDTEDFVVNQEVS